MGGCRCTFRDCKNSTTNMPGMHFFHFPYKDAERCKKWALYSGRIDFLTLPHSQLRNKTICGVHFADKFFMNFLKESLTRNAVPTLLKDVKGIKVEVQVDQSQLAQLEYPVQSKQHTIDLPEKITHQSTHSTDETESISSLSFDDGDAIECEKPKILNRVVSRPEHTAPVEMQINTYGASKRVGSTELTVIPRKRILVKQYKSEKESPPMKAISTQNQLLPLGGVKKRAATETPSFLRSGNPPPSQNIQTPSTSQGDQMVDNYPNTDEFEIVANDFDDTTSHDQLAESIKKENAPSATIDRELYLQTMAEHSKQIEDLKKILAEKLETAKNTGQQSASVSASSSSDVRAEMKIAKGPAMTKIQLFNGIRKYLNPSMVALLRMEIFGGSEREYRSDEKQIAKELYNLNASVYDYMREEWRFRLPAKAQVETWLKEPDDDDISEFF